MYEKVSDRGAGKPLVMTISCVVTRNIATLQHSIRESMKWGNW